MKKTINYLTVLALLLTCNLVSAQQFSINPEKPIGGEKVTITYNPQGGPLAGIQFDGVAYSYAAPQELTAYDLDFAKEGDVLVAQLVIPTTAKAVLFSFKNDELDKVDDNDGKGYKTLVHQTADRNTPVVGALAMKSMLYFNYGKIAGVKPDAEKAMNLAKQELAANPAALDESNFASNYAALAFKLKDEAAITASKAQIESLTRSKKATESDLRNAVGIASMLEDKALAESITKRADEQFPNGLAAKIKAKEAFKAAKTIEEKNKVFADAKAKFAKEKDMERFLVNWAGNIATEYANAGDWTNFEKAFAQITDRQRAAGVLNGLAWTLSGESIEAEGKDLKKGMELSARSLELLKKEMETPGSRPSNTSPKTWMRNLEFTTAMYADTYALLLYKNGKYAEALQYQTLACEKNDFADGEMTERYTVFFEKNKSAKETEALLAKLIAEGKATVKMSARHKELFLANNSLESAYEKYVSSLEKEAKDKKRAAVVEKMLDENAPAFTLRNLKGEEVSLEGLRGKVLVLDFWATWCGPCKASFPGMQMAVNKYANRKDVEFLFIDTWENGDDKVKQAGDFVASKSYTFNVLMDSQNEVVTKFGVSGIPTKFVVDPNGKIRFKSVGFNGNDQELVDELSLMIELAGGNSTP